MLQVMKPVILFSLLLVGFSIAGGVLAATFTVVNTDDDGAGSLRQAIVDANAAGGADTIDFNIPDGPFTIMLQSELPEITDPVVIDGATQPGYAGLPLIELNGQNAGNESDGLRIVAGDSTVRALSIGRFRGDGIELGGPGGNTIAGCHIGISPAGDQARNNSLSGIYINQSPDNLVGGAEEADRNLIGGNFRYGVHIDGESASANTVSGNWIGVGAHGSRRLGNSRDAVFLFDAPNNLVGGEGTGEGNLLSGNSGSGVRIEGAGAAMNVVAGNWIGSDAAGTGDLANSAQGVVIADAPGNTIGGEPESAGNLIVWNNGGGVRIERTGAVGNRVLHNRIGTDALRGIPMGNKSHGIQFTSSSADNQIGSESAPNMIAFSRFDGLNIGGGAGNAVRGNAIFLNGELGIDFGGNGITANDDGDTDTGSNALQNFPVLTEATAGSSESTVAGTLNSVAETEFVIDVFASLSCDPSGNGEGEVFLGSVPLTTDADGNGTFNATFSGPFPGRFITATATDPDGNTSEFSACLAAGSSLPPETFVVENTENAGPGSLRQAILEANGAVTSGADTIEFNIPGAGPHTIAPLFALPDVSDPVIIDATTQPGYTDSPIIELTGRDAGFASIDGLHLTGGDSVVRGLAINGFRANGIAISGLGGNRIEACWIGLNSAGAQQSNNGSNGISINDSSENRIGGADSSTGNVIAANNGNGVRISGVDSTGNVVSGNHIGTDPAGTTAIQNNGHGIAIESNAGGNTIGGTADGAGNLLSGNGGSGVHIPAGDGNVVIGNRIGTDAAGEADVPNRQHGVNVNGDSNQIGGIAAGEANTIAFNGSAGVFVSSSGQGNVIRGNRIFDNGALGIDLGSTGVTANDPGDTDSGSNLPQNYPVLTAASFDGAVTTVEGTLNSSADVEFRIDFYANDGCDATGHGEGREFLGEVAVSTDGDGNATFSATVAALTVGRHLSAIATDPDGNSSEFSACLATVNTASGAVLTVTNTDDDGPGSLRHAIAESNALLTDDTIVFDLPGDGPHVIAPLSPLPELTDPLTLDGTTQPGYDGVPVVVLSGSNAGFQADGLRLSAGNSVIRGLSVVGFRSRGVVLTIGGNNRIQGNYIGINPAGEPVANGNVGLLLSNSANNQIGGAASGEGNVVSGNGLHGIQLDGSGSTGNTIRGNRIGTDSSGTGARGNGRVGIEFNNGASANTVGGEAPGQGNIIAFNRGHGVSVLHFQAIENRISGNSIHANNERGILLGFNISNNDDGDGDNGPNGLQNYPLLTSATAAPDSVTIQGTLNSRADLEYRLDFFANQLCDDSGNGEGRQYLGSTSVTTDSDGDAVFDVTIPTVLSGRLITATATDPDGNTSEHSPCHDLDATTIPPATFTVGNTGDSGPGSLRQALEDSNATVASAPNNIVFEIPGEAPHVIELESGLPTLTEPVVVDGTTHPDFAGAPIVELVGNPSRFNGPGFRIIAGGSTIRGLVIRGFGQDGIQLVQKDGNTIEGNHIGVNGSATEIAGNNNFGILIDGSADNVIGGSATGAGNVISGNFRGGVAINRPFNVPAGDPVAQGNRILGNAIGTDPTGQLDLGNRGPGVTLTSVSDNVVGGVEEGQGNRIAFNSGFGVHLQGGAAAIRNVIRGNALYSNNSLGIALGFNAQLANDAMDADTGENGLQNHAVVTGASLAADQTSVAGTLHSVPDTEWTIDFYASPSCEPTGAGEGAQYLGSTMVTTDSNGDASFDASLPARAAGRIITSTVTGPEGTSQFSECFNAESAIPPATFTVINTDDAGPGSLRAAIRAANAAPIASTDRHEVVFDIAGDNPATPEAPRVIVLTRPLPEVIEPVAIDAATQSGYQDRPVVTLSGDEAGFSTHGITLLGGNSLIRGLAIGGFRGSPIRLLNRGGNRVEACFVGLNAAGDTAHANSSGILIENSAQNTIGGTEAGAGNLISGNDSTAVEIRMETSTENRILGNVIGLNAAGDAAIGNTAGVSIFGAPRNVIGGDAPGARNVISGNRSNGVLVNGQVAAENLVEGNYIGVDVSGTVAIGNNLSGVAVNGNAPGTRILGNLISGNQRSAIEIAADQTVVRGNVLGADVSRERGLPNMSGGVSIGSGSDNAIGGVAPGDGNLIAFNVSDGVRISGTQSVGNRVLGNDIHSNQGLGINLGFDLVTMNDTGDGDSGSNGLQNFPVITDATAHPDSTRIQGELDSTPDTEFRIEFFANLTCDPAGFGEGQKFLGGASVTTDGGGNAVFDATVMESVNGVGGWITSTATDPAGNTSEFSACFRADSTIPPETFTVTTSADAGLGSLRQAILDSNRHVAGGRNPIVFDIPADPPMSTVVIRPESHLPPVFQAAAIDGTTQPGASANGLATGSDAVLRIVLEGGSESGPVGLHLDGSGSLVRGLNVRNWTDALVLAGRNHVVEGNFLGTDDGGLMPAPNFNSAIRIDEGASDNLIGGTTPAARNLISGNQRYGVLFEGGDDNHVAGNLIGTDRRGTAGLPNGSDGIRFIRESVGNRIGGTDPGAANRIAFNRGPGVLVSSGGSIGNTISANHIFENQGVGIDLLGRGNVNANDRGDGDTGGNQIQNFPVITGAVVTAEAVQVAGNFDSTADSDFTLEFFANANCDASGHGEGMQYLGATTVRTDSTGLTTFDVTLPAVATGDILTATATDPDGNTSEFSECFTAEIRAASLAIGNVNVLEGNPPPLGIQLRQGEPVGTVAAFEARLDQPAETDVTFEFQTRPGSATGGDDFLESSGTGTIPAGSLATVVAVSIVRDTDPEPDETFFVDLSNVTGARLIDGSGTGTIEDDDGPDRARPLLAEESFDYPVGPLGGRNGGRGFSGPWSGDSFSGSVAEPGFDFGAESGRLDAVGNRASATRFQIGRRLINPLGDPGSTVYISFLGRIDGFQSSSLSLLDGDEFQLQIGQQFQNSNWSLRFTGTSFQTVESSVPANELAFIVVCLEFGPEQVGARLFVNPPLAGPPDQPDAVTNAARFPFDTVRLSGSSQMDIDEIRIGQTWSAVTPRFLPRLTISDVTRNEGDEGITDFVFAVNLSAPSEETVTVDFGTDDRDAAAAEDYTGSTGTLIFAPGETEQTVIVPVAGDTEEESNEFFIVKLSNPARAKLSDEVGLGLILDDDRPPRFLPIGVSVLEGDEGTVDAVFTVGLSAPWSEEVSVQYTTEDDGATAPVDYEPASGRLVFPPGTTEQTVTVTVHGDTRPEPFERFRLRLSDPAGALLGPPSVVCEIINDDIEVRSIFSVGDTFTATDGECRVILDILTTPVISESGRIAVQVLTGHCDDDGVGTQASHREAPLLVMDKDADLTDIYAFVHPLDDNGSARFGNVVLRDAPNPDGGFYLFTTFDVFPSTDGEFRQGFLDIRVNPDGEERVRDTFIGDLLDEQSITRFNPSFNGAESRPTINPDGTVFIPIQRNGGEFGSIRRSPEGNDEFGDGIFPLGNNRNGDSILVDINQGDLKIHPNAGGRDEVRIPFRDRQSFPFLNFLQPDNICKIQADDGSALLVFDVDSGRFVYVECGEAPLKFKGTGSVNRTDGKVTFTFAEGASPFGPFGHFVYAEKRLNGDKPSTGSVEAGVEYLVAGDFKKFDDSNTDDSTCDCGDTSINVLDLFFDSVRPSGPPTAISGFAETSGPGGVPGTGPFLGEIDIDELGTILSGIPLPPDLPGFPVANSTDNKGRVYVELQSFSSTGETADLSIVHQFDGRSIIIELTNLGPAPSQNIEVLHTTIFSSGDLGPPNPGAGTYDADTSTWSVPALDPNQSVQLTIPVTSSFVSVGAEAQIVASSTQDFIPVNDGSKLVARADGENVAFADISPILPPLPDRALYIVDPLASGQPGGGLRPVGNIRANSVGTWDCGAVAIRDNTLVGFPNGRRLEDDVVDLELISIASAPSSGLPKPFGGGLGINGDGVVTGGYLFPVDGGGQNRQQRQSDATVLSVVVIELAPEEDPGTGKTPAQVELTALTLTFDGTPRAVTVTTDPAGLNVVITYDGAAEPPVNAGSYAVRATVVDETYSGMATGTLVVQPASATILFVNETLRQRADNIRAVEVTTDPAGLNVDFTYDGAAEFPSAPGEYEVVATIADPNHNGSASATLIIESAEQPVLTLGNVAIVNGMFRFDVSGAPGRVQVQFTPSLDQPFTNLGEPTPGPVIEIPIGTGSGFVRVLLVD